MLPIANYLYRPPDWDYEGLRVTITPDAEPMPGEIDLYPQAAHVFGQLAKNNDFTGAVNTFQDIYVRRLHVLSEPACKTDAIVIPEREATALVRRLTPYRYRLDGRESAGFMVSDVPTAYATTTPVRHLGHAPPRSPRGMPRTTTRCSPNCGPACGTPTPASTSSRIGTGSNRGIFIFVKIHRPAHGRRPATAEGACPSAGGGPVHAKGTPDAAHSG